MNDKWVARALVIETEAARSGCKSFQEHGELIRDMLKAGEYKTVIKAGLHISNGLAKHGITLATAYLYAAAKAVTSWPPPLWKFLSDTACPIRILQVLAYRETGYVVDLVASIRDRQMTWAKWHEKNQRRFLGPRLKTRTKNDVLSVTIPIYAEEEQCLDALKSLMSQWGPNRFVSYYCKAAQELTKNGTKWPRLNHDD